MIEHILNLLEVTKKIKKNGNYISIALGKNKYPDSVREAYIIFKQQLWQDK